jgi:hypothetical protein
MTNSRHRQLVQIRVFCFSFLQDGDVRVSVLPEGEEILIGRFRFGRVALHGVGSADLQVSERADWLVQDNSATIEDYLELGGCFTSPRT